MCPESPKPARPRLGPRTAARRTCDPRAHVELEPGVEAPAGHRRGHRSSRIDAGGPQPDDEPARAVVPRVVLVDEAAPVGRPVGPAQARFERVRDVGRRGHGELLASGAREPEPLRRGARGVQTRFGKDRNARVGTKAIGWRRGRSLAPWRDGRCRNPCPSPPRAPPHRHHAGAPHGVDAWSAKTVVDAGFAALTIGSHPLADSRASATTRG